MLKLIMIIFFIIICIEKNRCYDLDSDEKYMLFNMLKNESDTISKKYLKNNNNGSLLNYIEIGNGSYCLSNKLTSAYFGRSKLTIGVTGGSATQGDYAWPNLLSKYLSDFGFTVDMRNAAQGSTSQVVTGPCLQQLIGGEGENDLILWEFGMNDIMNVEKHRTDKIVSDENVCTLSPIRCAAADCWIRDAIDSKPLSIGFVHLWDIMIHDYKFRPNDKSELPDRSFRPTNIAMRRYVKNFNSYFSINVMDMIHDLNLVDDKTKFLRDIHHPNDYGYEIITDLLYYALLETWMNGLEAFKDSCTTQSVSTTPPMFNLPNILYPKSGIKPHCLMSFPPQFGTYSAITPSTPLNASSIVHMGKVDAHRSDRKDFFLPSECEEENGNGGLYFKIRISNPKRLHIDVGLSDPKVAQQNYKVFFDNVELQNHLHSNSDNSIENEINHSFLIWYGGWQHYFNQSIDKSDKRLFHNLRICGKKQKVWGWHDASSYTYADALIARIVFFE